MIMIMLNILLPKNFNKLIAVNFTARLKQANLARKIGIANLVKEKDFHDKLKHVNKNVTSNRTKHVEAEKEISDLTKKVAQMSGKGYVFCQVEHCFTDNDG